MDFTRSNPRPHQAPVTQPAPAREPGQKTAGILKGWTRYLFIALLFSGTLLAILLILSVFMSKSTREAKFVNTSKYQAVFTNGAQGVYVGKITTLNQSFVRLQDVFIIAPPQTGEASTAQDAQTSASTYTLTKLECTLAGPYDEIIINRAQVLSWENLKEDGKVAKAVADFKKQNPEGPKCDEEPAATTKNEATPAATTPAKKP